MKKVQKCFRSGRLDDVVRLAFIDGIYFIFINKKNCSFPRIEKRVCKIGSLLCRSSKIRYGVAQSLIGFQYIEGNFVSEASTH